MAKQTYHQFYIEGILEGADYAKKYGKEDAAAHISNLNRTIKGFASDSSVGQMLRGERDYWKNVLAKSK